MRRLGIAAVGLALAGLIAVAGCGGGEEEPTSVGTLAASPVATKEARATATAEPSAPANTPAPMPTDTPKPPPTNTPEVAASMPSPVVDPCALVTSVEGVEPGPSFALNVNVKWQLCFGGPSGSAKYLFRTNDAEASWKLISRTTVPADQPPPAGVGQLPETNYPKQILFLDETHGWIGIGWMGMNTERAIPGMGAPGPTLWRSQDGGVTWASVSAPPPGVPVASITFTDSQHGTVVTPEGNWTTSDGGVTWTH